MATGILNYTVHTMIALTSDLWLLQATPRTSAASLQLAVQEQNSQIPA